MLVCIQFDGEFSNFTKNYCFCDTQQIGLKFRKNVDNIIYYFVKLRTNTQYSRYSCKIWDSYLFVGLGRSSIKKPTKVCLLSKGGGGGQNLNLNFFGCHFCNIEHFIAPHLDTRSGLSFIWYALGVLVQAVLKNVIYD